MAVDLGILQGQKSLLDLQNEFDQRKMSQQLQAAQIQKFLKPDPLDVDKLGEQGFLKAAQGLPLSADEWAAAKFIDAKSGGVQYNPVTGTVDQKPRISDKIGLPETPDANTPQAVDALSVQRMQQPITPLSSKPVPPSLPAGAPDGDTSSPFDVQFQSQLQQAAGNPKLQQSIKESYSKAKLQFNEDQAKSAGFIDRMTAAGPIIDANQAQGTNPMNQARASIPIVGNYLVPDEYQKLDQAERDFINAQLRRESGAAISSSEFDNARTQYFPQPGDSAAVLQQKAANRATAMSGMQRAAGPGYTPVKKDSTPSSKSLHWDDLQ